MRIVLDIEANGLLDNTTIDYTSSPYRLKDTFKMWCIVCKDIDTGEIYKFVNDGIIDTIKKDFPTFSKNVTQVIAHNGIDYDLLAIKLYLGIDYTVEPDTWGGRDVEIVDTLVISKCLNPDRYGGHSLDEWGKRVGYNKIDWREEAITLGLIEHTSPKGSEFLQYHPKMVDYCVRDTEVTVLTYNKLLEEMGNWPWNDAISLEKAVAEIIVRQKHRGFYFNKEVAEKAIIELDALIKERREKVEPLLPPKPLTKTALNKYTPPVRQFLKVGGISSYLHKFIKEHNGVLSDDNKFLTILGKKFELPLPQEPLITSIPATLKDTTHIKEWLVTLGWKPTQYKERDLTCNAKKQKLDQEQYIKSAERYIEQTLKSPFCSDRCEQLKTSPETLRTKILKHDISKPLKVYTNPTFTVGQEKEICPNLEKLQNVFPYAKDIVEFLTYQHRRNSILGGGVELIEDDEEDSDEYEKGFMANIREDGRISTPADTCGAGTSRFKHRVVKNCSVTLKTN